jgi:radical SAM superfamily enzyme YgiQ (UPF0313 family)
MRILLIATNRHDRVMSRMEARPLPIGLAYVAGHLDLNRHTLKVLDLMFSEDYLADAAAAVREFQPELIGVSIRNLDNGSYMNPKWFVPITKEVIQHIRPLSSATIVCGGPAFSVLPKECFAFVEPDLGIAGDAGETFSTLADRLDAKIPYHDLSGLVYREGEEVIFNGVRSYSNFTKPPRFEELDMAKYRQAGFGIGVLTKLGDFNYPTRASRAETDQAAWRVIRPIEEVVREVKEMEQRFGLRKVFFIDSGFNIPLDHAKALCRALMDAGLRLHWNTPFAPVPESCDAELTGLMKRAGCSLVMMGGAAGRDRSGVTLGEQLDALRQVCQLCEEGGLHYSVSQGFGEPGETRETVEEKLAFLHQLTPALANLRVGVRVLPGSTMAGMAVSEGLIKDESQLIQPTFYLAESVRDWIVDYLRDEAAHNPRWNLV